ncbi:HET-domain-containing protein [Lophium mytilinum]|uniref:HET-domain-containing protein n=1 Tax=Lophium mytilinum TaxID=390894 RepID=A0A6A6QP10_9PEZI|nr:HET-domain-containing protein [Lophium mytilinum]
MDELLQLESLMEKEFGWAEDSPSSIYTPLPTPTSIRVLKLSKDSGPNQQIICHVKVVDLDRLPQYSALSYTWGDPGADPNDNEHHPCITQKPVNGQYEILCNGHPIRVTKNCVSFLYSQRFWEGYLKRNPSLGPDAIKDASIDYLWIDAICINQESLEERSSQVRLMDRIYRQAQQVVVWLGPSDSMTDPAFKAIIAMAGAPVDELHKLQGSRMLDPAPYKTLGIRMISKHEWQSMRALYERSWFSRAWTLQEFVLARKAVMFCGHGFMKMQWLLLAAQNTILLGWDSQLGMLGNVEDTPENTSLYMQAHDAFVSKDTASSLPGKDQKRHVFTKYGTLQTGIPSRERDLGVPISQESSIHTLVLLSFLQLSQGRVSKERWLAQEDTFPLQTVLVASRSRKCSNPADKLYAVLGLVPEASWQYLPIDYSMPVVELYTRAAFVMIRATRSLSILSYVGDKTFRRYKALPSWVPDLTHPGLNMPLDIGSSLEVLLPGRRMMSFNASRGMRFHVNSQEISCATLPVRGIHYDTVQAIGDFDFTRLSRIEPLLDVIVRLPRDRLWRTLLANERVVHQIGERQLDEKPPHTAKEIDGEVFLFLLSLETWSMLCGPTHESPSDSEQPRVEDIAQQQYDIYEQIVGPELNSIPRSLFVDGKQPPFINRLQWCPPDTDRRLFTTQNQKLGAGMLPTQEGDEVWVLAGAKVPYVLRPKDDAQYELVGEAYMHDIMHGELVEESQSEVKDITLI